MKSMLPYRVLASVAFVLLATAFLTAFTGSGAVESRPDARMRATAEVAAVDIPAPEPRISRKPATKRTQGKRAFVDSVLPTIERENERIADDRARLIMLAGKLPLSDEDRSFLRGLAREYRVRIARSDAALIDALLARVDNLPPSLVLAQAAIESAWGTSRFAREGNNLFGEWCFKAGCGIVPAARDPDATHEVRRFDSVAESVHGYFMNINTHRAYRPLREIRVCQRSEGRPLSGPALAAGLIEYSAIGELYIEKVREMIRVNEWHTLDSGEQQLALNRYEEPQCPDEPGPAIRGSLLAAGE